VQPAHKYPLDTVIEAVAARKRVYHLSFEIAGHPQ
jgi:hypothetical protein